jgi:hypothetical protein
MIRTFSHSFDPPSANPIKGDVAELTTDEIEDAGIREVLQTPGATFGSWAILDALLAPTGNGSPFVFREPLGQAREIKVALSGLFGRFVARAYLERYFGLSIFSHLGQRVFLLDGKRRIEVRRKTRGDLPDWIACDSQLKKITIAEAKGCHDKQGPDEALARAWLQAVRIDIVSNGKTATAKRIAIATRWGTSQGGAEETLLAVRDPDEQGEMTPEELEFAALGLTRVHLANLLKALGHHTLADSLRALVSLRADTRRANVRQAAIGAVNSIRLHAIGDTLDTARSIDGLIGAWVTRAGPISESNVSRLDQETLQRLNLRPIFVGVERNLVNAAISDDVASLRHLTTRERTASGSIRMDGGVTWMVRPTDGIVIE